MGDLVFENNNAKLKSFFRLFIGSPIVVLLAVLTRIIKEASDDFGKAMTFTLIALVVSLVLGACFGLFSAHKISRTMEPLADCPLRVPTVPQNGAAARFSSWVKWYLHADGYAGYH